MFIKKKGQITIIIIIGIILLFIAFISSTFYFKSIVKPDTVQIEKLSLKQYISSCLQEQLIIVEKSVFESGGFFDLYSEFIPDFYYEPDSVYYDEDYSLDYYYVENSSLDPYFVEEFIAHAYLSDFSIQIPEIEEIEKEIVLGMNFMVFECFNNISVEYDIEKISLDSSVLSDRIEFFMEGDFIFDIDGSKYTEKGFYIFQKSDFMRFYEYAKNITSMQYENDYSDLICLDCLVDRRKDWDVSINLYYSEIEDSDVVLYQLGSNNFSFVHVFPEKEPSNELIFFNIPDQEAFIGEQFRYDLPAYGDIYSIILESYEDLLLIDNKTLTFTPNEKGLYLIPITIRDYYGNSETKVMRLNVLDPREIILSFKESHIAYIGEEFSYKISVSSINNNHVCFDDSSMFNLKADGTISFIPTAEDIGINKILITCINEYEGFAVKEMTIEVIEI